MNTDFQTQDITTTDAETTVQPQLSFVIDSDLAHVGGGSALCFY